MPIFLAVIIGWARKHWRLIAYAVLATVLFVAVVAIFQTCKPQPKFNEAEIDAGEQAKKEHNDKNLREIVSNSINREKGVDANVAAANDNARQQIEETRKAVDNMNRDELQAEFDRRAAESK
jgi:uncharacterized membrane protein YhiD involved in acid resistance